MNFLKHLTLFTLMFFSVTANAKLIRFNVPNIKVEGLQKYSGKYLTLFYVAGRNSSFGTESSRIHVIQIFSTPLTKQINQDEISFDKISIKRKGVYILNYVLAVVHDQPEYFIKNLNSTDAVDDPRVDDVNQLSEDKFDFISFEQFKTGGFNQDQQAEDGTIKILFE